MLLLVTVGMQHMPALRAGLGCICRIDKDNGLMVFQSLVDKLLRQVIEGPGYGYVPVFHPYPFGDGADAGKILKNEECALGIVTDECLADAVIHITHPTVFSLSDGFQSPSGGRGLHLLELTAKIFVAGALLFHGSAGEERGLSPAVAGRGKEADPAVDADDVRDVGWRQHLDFLRHRDVEKEPAVLTDELRRAEAAVHIHAFGVERDFDPSLQGVDRKQGPSFVQGIVPVPDKIELGEIEARPDPFMLRGEDAFVPADDRPDDGLRHLRAQAELLPDHPVQVTVQGGDAQITEQEDVARDEITCSGIGVHGIDQKLFVCRIRKDLQFCGECLFHALIIPQKVVKRNIRSQQMSKNSSDQRKERRTDAGPVRDAHPTTYRGGGFRVEFFR